MDMIAGVPQKDWEDSYIGPSKCDERRFHREKEVDDIWNELGLQEFKPENIIKLNPALDLFREACSCYQNGAFLASAVMCGVSVESALYLLSRTKKNPGTMSEEIDLGYAGKEWIEILSEGKRMKIVDRQTDVEIKQVRELRHFGVHYSQRVDKQLVEITKMIRGSENLKTWITKAEARQSLTLSAHILNHFISVAETRASSVS